MCARASRAARVNPLTPQAPKHSAKVTSELPLCSAHLSVNYAALYCKRHKCWAAPLGSSGPMAHGRSCHQCKLIARRRALRPRTTRAAFIRAPSYALREHFIRAPRASYALHTQPSEPCSALSLRLFGRPYIDRSVGQTSARTGGHVPNVSSRARASQRLTWRAFARSQVQLGLELEFAWRLVS